MLRSEEYLHEQKFCRQLIACISLCVLGRPLSLQTHMIHDCQRCQQAGNSNCIANDLHSAARRIKSQRSDEGSAIAIHSNTDEEISDIDGDLSNEQRSGVMTGLLHLRCDRQKPRCSRVGKYDRWQGGHRVYETGSFEELEVGLPRACLGRCWRPRLFTHSANQDEDWTILRQCIVEDWHKIQLFSKYMSPAPSLEILLGAPILKGN